MLVQYFNSDRTFYFYCYYYYYWGVLIDNVLQLCHAKPKGSNCLTLLFVYYHSLEAEVANAMSSFD